MLQHRAGIFVSLFRFGSANDIAVFLQEFDGTRNIRLVLLANVAELLGRQGIRLIKIIQTGNVRALQIQLRHLLRFDLANATVQSRNQCGKCLKTLLHIHSSLKTTCCKFNKIIITHFFPFVNIG